MVALLFAGAFSLAFTLFLTPLFIKLFHRLQWGQFIRDDGPQTHHTKRGTATMGGIVIILASVLGYFVGHLLTWDGIRFDPVTPSGLLVVFMMVGLGFVGFLDDYLKTRKQQSLGLGGWQKIAGQVVVATVFAVLAITLRDPVSGLTPASTAISLFRDLPLDFMALGAVIGTGLFIVWICLIVASASNGVNVADGLDGLAAGASIFSIGSYVIIGFWQFNQSCDSVSSYQNEYRCYGWRARSTSRSSRPPSWERSSASSGGTRRPRRSSWGTPARSASAARWRPSRSSAAPSCCSSSSAACS